MWKSLYRKKFDVRQCTTSWIIMTLDKSYSDNPTQCIYAVSKCFCGASSQDNLCYLVLFSWISVLYCAPWLLGYTIILHVIFLLLLKRIKWMNEWMHEQDIGRCAIVQQRALSQRHRPPCPPRRRPSHSYCESFLSFGTVFRSSPKTSNCRFCSPYCADYAAPARRLHVSLVLWYQALANHFSIGVKVKNQVSSCNMIRWFFIPPFEIVLIVNAV